MNTVTKVPNYPYKVSIARLHCKELERNNICTADCVSSDI